MKQCHYLSIPRCSNFKEINVLQGNLDEGNWDEYIVFDDPEEAGEFKKKLITFIKKNYDNPKVKDWYPEINNGTDI